MKIERDIKKKGTRLVMYLDHLDKDGCNRHDLYNNGCVWFEDENGETWKNYNEYIQENRDKKLHQLGI